MLHCSFIINVANFTGLGHDGTKIGCHRKQKKSNDQRAPVRYEEIKGLWLLEVLIISDRMTFIFF